jgi:hypothetical protein
MRIAGRRNKQQWYKVGIYNIIYREKTYRIKGRQESGVEIYNDN